jgi:hypothetical protein
MPHISLISSSFFQISFEFKHSFFAFYETDRLYLGFHTYIYLERANIYRYVQHTYLHMFIYEVFLSKSNNPIPWRDSISPPRQRQYHYVCRLPGQYAICNFWHELPTNVIVKRDRNHSLLFITVLKNRSP